MSTSISKKNRSPVRPAYHHGNLREALLEGALALIESGEELSLRNAAARAGVSTAAPYRHFQDRQALAAALATIGFDRLLASLEKARPAPRDKSRVAALARAYLAFAAANQGLYELMFTQNHLAVRHDEPLARSSTAAFMELETAVQAELKLPVSHEQAKLITTTLWATLHGLAMLAFERLIPAGGPADPAEAREVSLAAARLSLDSLLR